jgi:hypothetical protein
MNFMNEFYYPSADIRVNDNINEHINCTKIKENLGPEALAGILVHRIYIQIKTVYEHQKH